MTRREMVRDVGLEENPKHAKADFQQDHHDE